MSIKLRFDSIGWSSQAVLKDEALQDLIGLISKYKAEETPQSGGIAETLTGVPSGERSGLAKDWLSSHSASEILNLLAWQTNSEKILLLGAFHEAKGGAEGWRSADMKVRFSEGREPFPGNFPRDISAAIKEGLIATVTARTYKVSRVGWNKIAEAIAKLSAS